jgi:hypothetical protein
MLRPRSCALLLLGLALHAPLSGQAVEARHDLTLDALRGALDELTPRGWVPEEVVASGAGAAARFSVVWRREPGVAWEARYNVTAGELQETLDRLTPLGYVPTRIVGFGDRAEPRFAAILRREPGVAWEARWGVDRVELQRQIAAWSSRGYTPRSIRAYPADGDVRYAAIWRRDHARDASAALPSPDRAAQLPIEPVVQRMRLWCWLAVGEMVFRHHGIPDADGGGDFQCGILRRISGARSPCASDCYACERASGSNEGVLAMLSGYARTAAGRELRWHEARVVSPMAVMESIDAGRPIIAGTSYGRRRADGDVEHVALIVGYELVDGGMLLTVNDPFPYEPQENPFLRHGGAMVRERQYRIPYEVFRDALHWHWSVYDIAPV